MAELDQHRLAAEGVFRGAKGFSDSCKFLRSSGIAPSIALYGPLGPDGRRGLFVREAIKRHPADSVICAGERLIAAKREAAGFPELALKFWSHAVAIVQGDGIRAPTPPATFDVVSGGMALA